MHSDPFMSFVHFMLFLFRLLESRLVIGVRGDGATAVPRLRPGR
jgi:hypothetical protein